MTAPRRPLTLEDLDAVDAMTPPGQPGDKVDQAKASATVRRLTAALRSVMVDRDMWKGQATAMGKAALEAREQVRSLTERVKAIRRARDEVKAAGESVAPRNDPAAREALFARMSAAEKALSGLLEAL